MQEDRITIFDELDQIFANFRQLELYAKKISYAIVGEEEEKPMVARKVPMAIPDFLENLQCDIIDTLEMLRCVCEIVGDSEDLKKAVRK